MPHRNTQNIVGMVAAERTGLSKTGDFKLSLSLVLMLPSLASRAKPDSQLGACLVKDAGVYLPILGPRPTISPRPAGGFRARDRASAFSIRKVKYISGWGLPLF
jgi:hypothetical protein